MPPKDAHGHDATVVELGRLAQVLDGSLSVEEDAAGRAELERALELRPSGRLRAFALSAAALLVVSGVGFAFFGPRAAPRVGYQLSGPAMRIEEDWLSVPADGGAGQLRFSEGTRIELAPGSEARVAEATARGARVVLRSGALRARVVHREDSRWLVGAGPYSIEVTGTAFAVDWSRKSERLELRLSEGSVVVRGPQLHEGIRVAAGQRLTADARSGAAELSSTARETRETPPRPPPPAPAAVEGRGRVAVFRPAPSWSDLLTKGEFRAVLKRAEARGVESTLRSAPLADLVALSDAARYSGELALARRGLRAQRSRFPRSPEARAAAFLLGRMADDEGAHDEALRLYEQYLREAPRGVFAAEALGRKLVVLVRAHDDVAARAVAKSYLARFARGTHADYAREVLQRR